MRFIKKFIKEKKVWAILFIVSLVLVLKNSAIPYGPLENVEIIHFVFDQFKNDGFRECAKVLEIFLSSYATGLVFYYITEYVPKCEKEELARKTLQKRLIRLYEEMTLLYYMYRCTAELQVIWKPDSSLDSMLYSNECVYCHKRIYRNNKTDSYKFYFKFIEDGKKCIESIQRKSEKITSLLYFQYLDEDAKDAITQMDDLELFSLFPQDEKRAIRGINYMSKLTQFEEYRNIILKQIIDPEIISYTLMNTKEKSIYENEIEKMREGYEEEKFCYIMLNGNKY